MVAPLNDLRFFLSASYNVDPLYSLWWWRWKIQTPHLKNMSCYFCVQSQ